MPIPEGPRAPRPTAPRADDVPVVPWPSGADERGRLAAAGRPRILAVNAGEPPPIVTDDIEDWVRVPVDIDELSLRRRTAHERWLARRGALWLDDDGLVHRDGRWVALPAAQAAAAAPLIADAGRVVPRAVVRRACEEVVGPRSDSAFTAVLSRLRPKLAELGAVVHRLSGGRLLLEVPQFTDTSASRNKPETIAQESVARPEPRAKEWVWTQEIPRGC